MNRAGGLSVSEQVEFEAAQSPEFKPVNLELTLTLYRVVLELTRAHTEELEPVGLTLPQLNILTVLHRTPSPLTMRQVADSMSMMPNGLTAVVNSLSAKGLVVRSVNPGDQRSYFLNITQLGRQLLESFLPGHWTFLDNLYGALDDAERRTAATLLARLLVSLSQPQIEGPQGHMG